MKLLFYTIIFSSLILSSCQETFDPDLPEAPKKLVVDCQFTPGMPWALQLSHTKPVLGQASVETISNANVEIYEDGNLIETLQFLPNEASNHAMYIGTSRLPREDKEYSLRVFVPGYPVTTSKSKIPETQSRIESFERVQSNPGGDDIYLLHFSDQDESSNFYHVAVTQKRYELQVNLASGDTSYLYLDEKNTRFIIGNEDPLFGFSPDPSAVSLYNSRGFLLNDQHFNLGQKHIYLQVLAEDIQVGDPSKTAYALTAELRNVSEEYYRYYESIADQTNAQENTILLPVEVANNIQNGYGNFSGYSVVNSVPRWQTE